MNIQTLIEQWSALWTPPQRLPLSDWAEQHYRLSHEYAVHTGPLVLSRWQRELYDAFTDPRVSEITCMLAIQLTKTLFIQCALAYIIAEDPGPVLLLEPKERDAEDFSKERLKPMLRDMPILRDKVSDELSNTILSKRFAGGRFNAVSASVPGNLAGRTIRYLFCDEIDKYDISAGSAGDPISLARGRTTNFGSLRKIVHTCSPTIKGESRIELAYDSSDQRKPWVPCPDCGEFQILRWSNVKWGEHLPPELRGATDEVPGPTYYRCCHCESHWNDQQRRKACELLQWRADKPFRGHAGFWINHLYSTWNSMSELAHDFLVAKKSKETLKVFITERLAELWQEDGTVPDEQLLYERRESYPFGDDAVVPKRGLFLTAAVDVQENPPRLECEVVAWGRDRESWSIDYQVIQVSAKNDAKTLLPVTAPELWQELDRRILQREYPHELGGTLPVWLMAIDTGTRPQPVYEFALRHPQPAYNTAGGVIAPHFRSVVPVKGNDDDQRIVSGVSNENAARKRQNVRIVSIGTHRCKTEIFDALRHIKPDPDENPVINCLHFPKYERGYFEGLCSERRIVKSNGKVEWEKQRERNEPLDLKVYNRGAAAIVGIDRFSEQRWLLLEKALKIERRPEPTPQQPVPQQPIRRTVRGSYL